MLTTTAPIADVMTRNTLTARPEAPIESLIELMTQRHVGCVPIVDDRGRPSGIVTKLDLLECRGEARSTARELMMPLVMTLPVDASVADAARLLAKENVHHVLVVDPERTLVGVVSTLDITRWVARQ